MRGLPDPREQLVRTFGTGGGETWVVSAPGRVNLKAHPLLVGPEQAEGERHNDRSSGSRKDMTVPYSRNMDPTYENFMAECPHCDAGNIFNRASDLRTFRPIDLRTVT